MKKLLSIQDIEQLAQDCMENLDSEEANEALMHIGIFPSNIKESTRKKTYFVYILEWENYSKSVEVFNRKLNQYCRGDKLNKGITDRMCPWWKLE
ncbi:hypothetical protein [Candidatus Uabimicrobium sp. HlEnr_7]|uniref:hypothetical protein n=1 Tax=Candidatus Uabimicrobium helgolandensis TaxID=3095367 RepID=UPI0035591D2A